MSLSSVIIATGSYLPAKQVSNDELAKTVETNDAWIRERTGIVTRHIAAEGEFTSHMAIKACEAAIANYNASSPGLSRGSMDSRDKRENDGILTAADIDGIVVGTSTPDTTMPSVATKIQAALGTRGAALDVGAACTGFVSALSVAHGWIMTGVAKRILVIGAESMSRIIDWTDRGTCILFGDGAGAVILEAQENAGGRGIKSLMLDAAGELGPLLGTNGGTVSTKTAGTLFMQGQEVFRHGVEKMSAATLTALEKAGLTLADVDWVVAHQANARMIRMIARQLRVPEDKFIVTVDRHANTSAASIPLALDTAAREGKFKKGNIIAMPALGAGLTWGCCVASW